MPDFITTGLPEDQDQANEQPREVVNPLYARQAALHLSKPSVILIGCGGVGCWIATALVLGGVESIYLFDGDTLSSHNLNRFPLPESKTGSLKSVALAEWLQTLRPRADIRARGEFDPVIHSQQAEWVVCATDSLKSRQIAFAYSREIGAYYLEVGADGERWSLSPTPPEFSTELEARAGYASVPVHVGPCMMAASAASYYILHNTIPTYSHSARWIGGIGRLEAKDIAEVDAPRVICRHCRSFETCLTSGLIAMIKHVREYSGLGLAEAKAIVDKWWEEDSAAYRETQPQAITQPTTSVASYYILPQAAGEGIDREQVQATMELIQRAQEASENAEMTRIGANIHNVGLPDPTPYLEDPDTGDFDEVEEL